MKCKTNTIITILALVIVNMTQPVLAETQYEPQPVFSLEPTGEDLERLNSQPQEPDPIAWTEDLNGNITPTETISNEELKGLVEYVDEEHGNFDNNGGVSVNFMEDYGTYIYSYVWQYYTENYNAIDRYRFFQGSCSVENLTGSDITLKYIQAQSKSNTWSVTGKVEVEAEFKVAMLAKLTANAGVSVTHSWVTQASSTIEMTMTVRPGYTGTLSRYKQGAYSRGAGCWKKYKVIKATGQVTDLGSYYETGTAWGICQNVDNYIAQEIPAK